MKKKIIIALSIIAAIVLIGFITLKIMTKNAERNGEDIEGGTAPGLQPRHHARHQQRHDQLDRHDDGRKQQRVADGDREFPAAGHAAEVVEREGAVAGHRLEGDQRERVEEEDAQEQSCRHQEQIGQSLAVHGVSFDAAVNKANAGFALILQNWTGTFFSGTFSQSQYPSEITLATPNVFQHFSINLASFNPGAVPTGQTWQIAWQMDEFAYGGPVAGDQLIIDNVMVTMVPEPSSLALTLLGAASFAFLRRRRV